jgi:hypothetical protein
VLCCEIHEKPVLGIEHRTREHDQAEAHA